MDAADFYSGIVVDAYAALKSTSFAAQRYADFVRSHGEPGLEIGCGDGEPLLDLLASGLDVDGIDSSADMVARCLANAQHRGLDATVFCQRVEDLALPRRYASIYFAGPTFNLIPDDATALRALVAIGEHLSEGGTALVPLWIPGRTPPEHLGVTSEAHSDGTVLRYTPLSETVDPAARTRTTATRYERETATGRDRADRTWIIHWHTPAGFRQMCLDAGLNIVRMVDDGTGRDATDTSTAFTATVRRA